LTTLLTLKTTKGEVAVSFPAPADFDSCFLFAMHKSGSTLMYQMMRLALSVAGIPTIALSEIAFGAGLPENEILNADAFILGRGYCYLGYREFPPYLRGRDIAKNKKILLIRDPRDMLVSAYFSDAYSHVLPPTGDVRAAMETQRTYARKTDINDYCISHANLYLSEFAGYEALFPTEMRIYRYEDVIFKKQAWLQDMLTYLGVNINGRHVETIASNSDQRPERERPAEHIRQVTPGNFRKHLTTSAISRLNAVFADILSRYNYAV
jgi:hypothetical protein